MAFGNAGVTSQPVPCRLLSYSSIQHPTEANAMSNCLICFRILPIMQTASTASAYPSFTSSS